MSEPEQNPTPNSSPMARFLATIKSWLGKKDKPEQAVIVGLCGLVAFGIVVAGISAISNIGGSVPDPVATNYQVSATNDNDTTSANDVQHSNDTTPTDARDGNTASTLTPLDPSNVGQAVLTRDEEQAICASAISQGDADRSSDARDVHLLDDASMLIECNRQDTDASGNSIYETDLIKYDLYNRSTAWGYKLPENSQFEIGSAHIFELDPTGHAAEGLNTEFTTYELKAVSLDTGTAAWTVPFETWLKGDELNATNPFLVSEPTGTSQVVVSFSDASGFDPATGNLLWHKPTTYSESSFSTGAQQYYLSWLAPNGVEITGEGGDWRAASIQNDQPVWKFQMSAEMRERLSYADVYYDGSTLLAYGDSGYVRVDAATGKLLGEATFPSGWEHTRVRPPYAVTQVNDQLRFFNLDNLQQPAWSLPADSNPSIELATADHLAVRGPTGVLLLSIKDGSTVTTLTDRVNDYGNGVDFIQSSDVKNGLILLSNGTVLEIEQPASQ